jgi:hypothetical protein
MSEEASRRGTVGDQAAFVEMVQAADAAAVDAGYKGPERPFGPDNIHEYTSSPIIHMYKVASAVAFTAIGPAEAVVQASNEARNVVRFALSGPRGRGNLANMGTSDLLMAMQFDIHQLAAWAQREGWTEQTPVPPELLGPLWPAGPSRQWPKEPTEPDEGPPVLQLEFAIPVGIPKEEADRLVGEIIQRANELHHAMGGNGLSISEGSAFECEPALAPVGGDDDSNRGDTR